MMGMLRISVASGLCVLGLGISISAHASAEGNGAAIKGVEHRQQGQGVKTAHSKHTGVKMSQQRIKSWVFVGGYGTSIETFSLDPATGALASVAVTEGIAEAPTFLAVDEKRNLLFAISEKGGADGAQPGRATSFAVDAATGKLTKINEVSAGGDNAVFVVPTRSGKNLLTASSSTADGRVAVIPVSPQGQLSAPSASLTAGKNAHGLVQSPNGEFVWAVCRGDDTVVQYRLNEDAGTLTPLASPRVAISEKPAGPRHIAVHPALQVVYVLLDWGGKIVSYQYAENGLLVNPKTVSIYPKGKQPKVEVGGQTAAEIEVSRDGKHVYATTRAPGFHTIAILNVGADGQLSLVANEDAEGLIKGPRHFSLSSNNQFLVLANQDSNSLLSFNVDPVTGLLHRSGGEVATRVHMPNAVAVGMFQF